MWTQQGPKLVGTFPQGYGGIYQGSSVSLAADGNTAIVGGSEPPFIYTGEAWVFIRRGGVWSQQGSMLINPAGIGGHAVLSTDGNTALLSGSRDDDAANGATPFIRTDRGWRQQGTSSWPQYSVLVGNSFRDDFGRAALSANGNIALVGGFYQPDVGIFTRTQGVWSEQSSALLPTGSFDGSQISVALSADGYTALVGVPREGGAA
jgi:hypothetical protein